MFYPSIPALHRTRSPRGGLARRATTATFARMTASALKRPARAAKSAREQSGCVVAVSHDMIGKLNRERFPIPYNGKP
jgi:hypothetical protein